MRVPAKRAWIGALCVAALALGAGPPVAQAAFDDPLFVFTPDWQPPQPPPPFPVPVLPPPEGKLEGPCGVAVGSDGNFRVSDYYHHVIDVFNPAGVSVPEKTGGAYVSQITGVDPLDGPCGLAFDGLGNLYVNNFHRNVARFNGDAGTVIDSAHPTGVAVDPATDNVYVNDRTHIAVYDPAGTELGQIGAGDLLDGYGLAVSGFAATAGHVYVPDAATDTVKVYDSVLGATSPIATISGANTPNGHFVSLRDAAVAVDNATGEVYVADNLQSEYIEQPETVVYVFNAVGGYEGRLKYSIANALPAGLTVDNSGTASQSRVYVTSGNTSPASVYAYKPHSATVNAVPLLALGAAPAKDSASAVRLGPSPLTASPASSDAGVGASSVPALDSSRAPAAAKRSSQRKAKRARRVANRLHARPGRR